MTNNTKDYYVKASKNISR